MSCVQNYRSGCTYRVYVVLLYSYGNAARCFLHSSSPPPPFNVLVHVLFLHILLLDRFLPSSSIFFLFLVLFAFYFFSSSSSFIVFLIFFSLFLIFLT